VKKNLKEGPIDKKEASFTPADLRGNVFRAINNKEIKITRATLETVWLLF
jgi:hypothetical protein